MIRTLAIVFLALAAMSLTLFACSGDDDDDNGGDSIDRFDNLANCYDDPCSTCGEFCRNWLDKFPNSDAATLDMVYHCEENCEYYCSESYDNDTIFDSDEVENALSQLFFAMGCVCGNPNYNSTSDCMEDL